MQLTNISHVRDLSSMLALAVEKPAAASAKIFNCVSDRAITFNGLAKLCAEAAGRPLDIVYYDPKTVGVDARKAFPFRNMVNQCTVFPKRLLLNHLHIQVTKIMVIVALLCRTKSSQRVTGLD